MNRQELREWVFEYGLPQDFCVDEAVDLIIAYEKEKEEKEEQGENKNE